jgi:hypothetical protein
VVVPSAQCAWQGAHMEFVPCSLGGSTMEFAPLYKKIRAFLVGACQHCPKKPTSTPWVPSSLHVATRLGALLSVGKPVSAFPKPFPCCRRSVLCDVIMQKKPIGTLECAPHRTLSCLLVSRDGSRGGGGV